MEISARKRISRRSLTFIAPATYNDVWSGRKKGKKKQKLIVQSQENRQQEESIPTLFLQWKSSSAWSKETDYMLLFSAPVIPEQPGGKKYGFISTLW